MEQIHNKCKMKQTNMHQNNNKRNDEQFSLKPVLVEDF